MTNPFGAFNPSLEPPEAIDATFEEVPIPPSPAPMPPTTEEVVAEIEAALDEEVSGYRQRLGLISPHTLSKILGVHHDTLKGWRTDNKGPNYLRIGKRVWYSFEHVLDWLPTTKVRSEKTNDNTKKGLQQDERAKEPDQPKPAGDTPSDPP